MDIAENSLESAHEKFEAAGSFFRKSGLSNIGDYDKCNPYYLSSLALTLAALNYKLGNYPQATQHLTEVDTIASEFGFCEHLVRSKLWKAKVLITQNLQKNQNKIVELYISALKEALPKGKYLLRNLLKVMAADFNSSFREGYRDITKIVKPVIEKMDEEISIKSMTREQVTEVEIWSKKFRRITWSG